jgi:hypothetical protein
MFEKEAEEISNKLVEKGSVAIAEDRARQDMQYAFKKGAELGYKKANEWHYVKDGKLPKDNKEVLVYMWDSFYIGYYNLQWHFDCFSEESEQVTAWKEIVPPKESE